VLKAQAPLMPASQHSSESAETRTALRGSRPRDTPPAPSQLAFVPFVSVDNMMKIVNQIGLPTMLREMSAYLEADFERWEQFDKSPRVAAHSKEGVIELMPTSDGATYGFKYVNGHPANMARGFQTVTAFGVLAKVSNGYPVLLTEMTILTALRTAATSVVAAKYLAPAGASVMAMIGNGTQCEFQVAAFRELLGIESVRLYDIDRHATDKAVRNLATSGIDVVACNSAVEAIAGAQIVTTCTADKQYATILTDDMIGTGVHINAIGGDCPGKTELQRALVQRADIFVEYAPQTRIEGEIQQLPPDHRVTELWQVINGDAKGRSSDGELTLFDSVGFAIEDFSALRYVHDQLETTGHFTKLDMIADPDDPRDLFGMINRAGSA